MAILAYSTCMLMSMLIESVRCICIDQNVLATEGKNVSLTFEFERHCHTKFIIDRWNINDNGTKNVVRIVTHKTTVPSSTDIGMNGFRKYFVHSDQHGRFVSLKIFNVTSADVGFYICMCIHRGLAILQVNIEGSQKEIRDLTEINYIRHGSPFVELWSVNLYYKNHSFSRVWTEFYDTIDSHRTSRHFFIESVSKKNEGCYAFVDAFHSFQLKRILYLNVYDFGLTLTNKSVDCSDGSKETSFIIQLEHYYYDTVLRRSETLGNETVSLSLWPENKIYYNNGAYKCSSFQSTNKSKVLSKEIISYEYEGKPIYAPSNDNEFTVDINNTATIKIKLYSKPEIEEVWIQEMRDESNRLTNISDFNISVVGLQSYSQILTYISGYEIVFRVEAFKKQKFHLCVRNSIGPTKFPFFVKTLGQHIEKKWIFNSELVYKPEEYFILSLTLNGIFIISLLLVCIVCNMTRKKRSTLSVNTIEAHEDAHMYHEIRTIDYRLNNIPPPIVQRKRVTRLQNSSSHVPKISVPKTENDTSSNSDQSLPSRHNLDTMDVSIVQLTDGVNVNRKECALSVRSINEDSQYQIREDHKKRFHVKESVLNIGTSFNDNVGLIKSGDENSFSHSRPMPKADCQYVLTDGLKKREKFKVAQAWSIQNEPFSEVGRQYKTRGGTSAGIGVNINDFPSENTTQKSTDTTVKSALHPLISDISLTELTNSEYIIDNSDDNSSNNDTYFETDEYKNPYETIALTKRQEHAYSECSPSNIQEHIELSSTKNALDRDYVNLRI